MNKVIRIGLVAVTVGTFFFSIVSAKAGDDASERSNPFTKHGLPVPGAYFNSKAKMRPGTIAVSKSEMGLGSQKQLTANSTGKSRS
jgi:hypothetical protein